MRVRCLNSTSDWSDGASTRPMLTRVHVVFLVNPGHDVDQLRASMEKLASSSPNCQEFMSKHRSKDIVEKVGEVRLYLPPMHEFVLTICIDQGFVIAQQVACGRADH